MSPSTMLTSLVVVAGIWLSRYQGTALMWPYRANSVGPYETAYSYQRPVATWGGNTNNWGTNSGSSWGHNQGSNWGSQKGGGSPWPQPNGWHNTGHKGQYVKPPKGNQFRRCYDSAQCTRGECCQYAGYSNTGICRYDDFSTRYGCRDNRPNTPYPNNNKGGVWPPRQNGRPGSCPPPEHWRDPFRPCRTDEDCPALQKCCTVQQNRVCQHPILA